MISETASATLLSDYQPPPWLIETVDLRFDLKEQGTRVIALLTLRRNPAFDGDANELRLHGEGLKLIWLRMDGEEMAAEDYRIEEDGLVLLHPREHFLLESEVEIEPENNTALEGLYRSGGLFCTQCEAEGFRRITWYLDRPDVMARYKVRIEADQANYPVLLSNGNLLESGDLPGGRHYAEWEDPFPKPSYLFALVAGDLQFVEDWFVTASGRKVRLRIYVEPENIGKCEHAMRSLMHAMRWDEEKYGREYDLDVFNIVAVNDFNMGAMENKGLNIFNSKFVLASPETATDADYQGIEGVIAHEYFHNWTGNRITCRDWFQLSLKEGFTVYRDQEFSADMGSRPVKRIDDVRLLRAHQFAEDASPMAHPVRPSSYIEINNFYTVTVYEKGAEVVRMQANLLGPETFRRATDLYFKRFDGQAVTTEDFVDCMEQVSTRDLSQFKRWYDYAGTPLLKVRGKHHPDSQTYRLTVEQRPPGEAPLFHIPLVIGLLDREGRDLPLVRADGAERPELLEITKAHQVFEFRQVPSTPVPSLLRGFSAPVKLDYPYNDAELIFLMAHDSDGFSRWDAGQTLMQRLILGLVEGTPQAGDLLTEFTLGVHRTLEQALDDPALTAEVLSLPSESYLGEQMKVVNVDGIHVARERVKAHLGQQLTDRMLELIEQLNHNDPTALDSHSMGERRLRNVLLGYLMAARHPKAVEHCVSQYQAGRNMTDVMAALTLLADSDLPQREAVLADFEQRWQHDVLVMDKWFSAQAMSSRTDTLQRVRTLMRHPMFSLSNPNKVRALIGAFVNANPLRFHAADGSGYRLLIEVVEQLDPLNPQIAARLLRSLSRWRRYDETRQKIARELLQSLLKRDALSKDVYEITARSLEA